MKLLPSFLFSFFLIISVQAQENTCSPAKTGNPCASSSRHPTINAGAGNPIHLISGNKFQLEEDVLLRPNGLVFTRYYNSLATLPSSIGAGWRHSYSTQLYRLAAPQSWQILLDDGQRIMFEPSQHPNPQRINARIPAHGYLQQNEQQQWEWHTPEGNLHVFNPEGYLQTLTIAGFKPIHLYYTQHQQPLLVRIQAEDESISLHYNLETSQPLLTMIDTPVGKFHYHYDTPQHHPHARLNHASTDENWQRQYLYEESYQAGDPYRLTGIALNSPKHESIRLNEWHYRDDGKAIYSNTYAMGKLYIDYPVQAKQANDTSLTIVRDDKGDTTHIKGTIKAGEYLIEEVSGAGCYLCPSVGTQARYNHLGQLIYINGVDIKRNELSIVEQIRLPHPTWQQLTIQYDAKGQVKNWHSPIVGTKTAGPHKLERFQFNQETLADSSRYATFKNDEVHYKNGLILKQKSINHNEHKLILMDNNTPLWEQTIRFNRQNQLIYESIDFPTLQQQMHYDYIYDSQGRLISHRQYKTPEKDQDFYFYRWNADGSSAAIEYNDTRQQPQIKRHSSGLIDSIDDTLLHYTNTSTPRISHIDKPIPTYYTYDQFGRRTEKSTSDEVTYFSYTKNRLTQEETVLKKSSQIRANAKFIFSYLRDYYYLGNVPIGFSETQQSRHARQHQDYYIHHDHLGRPMLVSDSNKQIVWAAFYSPLGKASILKEDITFNLRQAGQYYDKETTWHDNYFRTYDPHFGHYLEPDPLGPVGFNDPFGYAAQQPRHYVDPLGLLLFAFDGTTNNAQSNTNVWKFYNLYQGDKFYTEGPGAIPDESLAEQVGGALFASTIHSILNEHKTNLLNYMSARNGRFSDVIPIDIVGFSRGAAIGMIFANYIKSLVKNGLFHYHHQYTNNGLEYIRDIQTCVDLRYIGLFDTVAQFGANGLSNSQFDYTAAPEWELITHAIALNEYRSLLPITLYQGANNVTEQGFLGNHSDIGGVLVASDVQNAQERLKNPRPDLYGDLSHIPLAWTYTQAQQLGLPLRPLGEFITMHNIRMNLAKVQNPLLHNTYGEYYIPNMPSRPNEYQDLIAGDYGRFRVMDRQIQAPNTHQRGQKQGYTVHVGDQTRQEHINAAEVQFIEPYSAQSTIAGVGIYGLVNAEKYLQWLENKLQWYAPLEISPTPSNSP